MFGGLGSIAGFDWSILADGPQYVNPMHFPNTVISSPTGQAAIRHNLRGINSTICAGLASGLYALDYASRMLVLQRAPALLAGGVEEICEESAHGFERLGMLSPTGRPRPFAADRDGSAQGEGAALFMLETAQRAAARGVKALARLAGFASAHAKAGEPEADRQARAAANAMRAALETADISAPDIGLIVASASGSRSGDDAERQALEAVFARPLGDLPVLAPKKLLGETLGAGGALAAAAAILAVSRPDGPSHALVNAIDCSGECASLVVSKLDDQPQ
jgi:3-oxoacyl-[acyl-carrier-protein] synthase II